ncbi:MAG: protein phosphatase 2C domain-containing protein [Stenomitos frigidus ULC029]
MHSDTTIHCPNHGCQAPNLEQQRYCQQCSTFLPKRYLWAIGKSIESCRSGDLLAARYRVKQHRILLDTKPGLLPEAPTEISPDLEPYLRLAPYQLHVPQVYGVVALSQKRSSDIVLLEEAPLYMEGVVSASSMSLEAQLMPELTAAWRQATALRQLHWLWQIAHLWEPLAGEGVATSLLQPTLLRVEGSLVRLLSLQTEGTPATLAALGQLWQQWQPTAQPEIAAFLGSLCQLMQQGVVRNAEQLITLIDRALADRGRSQSRHLHIATVTDQGPSRQRNEDACYPPSGTCWASIDPSQTQPLVVVCDGIGGHEGGNVASNLAIDTVQQQLQALPPQGSTILPTVLMLQLERVALYVNDIISQRNDSEQRHERQRMGTTLVTALAREHELYLTHVGDSRIYRITRSGCHQVTLDDDLASREVRLGYALYRQALQQPGSGSLVQALGMNASTLLHPTVQRFVLDEDCVFLLCSDGLSDYDRVEEYWQSELLPLLDGKVDVAMASQRLLTLANRVNGHDNVTIGLLHCHVSANTSAGTAPLSIAMDVPDLGTGIEVGVAADPAKSLPSTVLTQARTQIISTRKPATNPFVLLLSLLAVLGFGGVVAYAAFPGLRLWAEVLLGVQSIPVPPIATPSPSPSPLESPATNAELAVGSLIRVQRATAKAPPTAETSINGATPTATETPLTLWSQPGQSTFPKSARVRLGTLPIGSVLQISSRQAVPDRGDWLKLKLCSLPGSVPAPTPTPASTAPSNAPIAASLQPGDSGWIEQEAIAPLVTQNLGLNASQLGMCAPLLTEPTPSPVPTALPTTVPQPKQGSVNKLPDRSPAR